MNTEALSNTLLFLERDLPNHKRDSDEFKLLEKQMAELTGMIITISKRQMELRGLEA